MPPRAFWHYHSVVKEIYWEFMLSVYHALGRAYNVAAYLTSERGLSMLLQEENKEMIARSYKLKLEDLDEDLEAVQDDDGLEDLIDYNLLCQYYSELSSVLLLLSIGDPLTKIHEESAAVMSADEAMEHNKANRNNSTSFVAEHALSLSGILGSMTMSRSKNRDEGVRNLRRLDSITPKWESSNPAFARPPPNGRGPLPPSKGVADSVGGAVHSSFLFANGNGHHKPNHPTESLHLKRKGPPSHGVALDPNAV